MKWNWSSLKQRIQGLTTARSMEEVDPGTVKQMARGIMTTRLDEIGCTECYEQMDQFVDLVLAGKSAADAMPLVQDHLDRCLDCQEEFRALLAALHVHI
jgi:hypothetical protein